MIPASLVILSGGRSSRMQQNKAFVRVGGQRIIDIILARLKPALAEVMIVSNEPELYAELGVPVHTDIYPRMGPVAGIHTGLVRATNAAVLIIGCDMPFITPEVAGYMVERLGTHQAAVPQINGFLQPLAAVYHQSCIPVLEQCLRQERLKLVRIFEELEHTVVNAGELSRFGSPEILLMNVNDSQALARAQAITAAAK